MSLEGYLLTVVVYLGMDSEREAEAVVSPSLLTELQSYRNNSCNFNLDVSGWTQCEANDKENDCGSEPKSKRSRLSLKLTKKPKSALSESNSNRCRTSIVLQRKKLRED